MLDPFGNMFHLSGNLFWGKIHHSIQHVPFIVERGKNWLIQYNAGRQNYIDSAYTICRTGSGNGILWLYVLMSVADSKIDYFNFLISRTIGPRWRGHGSDQHRYARRGEKPHGHGKVLRVMRLSVEKVNTDVKDVSYSICFAKMFILRMSITSKQY